MEVTKWLKPTVDRRLAFGEAAKIAHRSSITLESVPCPHRVCAKQIGCARMERIVA